ncbi:Glycine-rich family protein [Rhynchospora pubera]|uniref:Glycine-rich family protein n=1 Tax=Rhynchospora pubera TaxID=906938 RepID=A0AAV8HNB4_9POAL|nr:Glycine-rich family protein [Rhynchospora pubera]
MATTTGTESSTDGPVLSVVSKRIRALRKKYNRITQMEEALANGKTLNKEQEEVLRSKPVVTALIDELEKLRSPLTSALAEEVQQTSDQKPKQSDRSLNSDELIEDLLRLVYFGSLFDVRSQSEFTAMMLTRSHERGCCLTYDYVTDDEVDLLSEKDLNLISVLGSLVTSRPVNEVVSHKSALEACISHAKQWLSSSDQPINQDVPASYAGLKEKLKKIISSDFFTATPEMKAPVEVAAAVGQLHISEDSTVPSEITEGDISTLDNKFQEEQENSQSSETYTEHQSEVPDEPDQKDEAVDVNPSHDLPPVQNEQQNLGEADIGDQDHDDSVPKDQQFVTSGRRSYPNGRGGGRGGGGRRPYPNGRGGGGHGTGGRGGGGGYSNGGRGYYQDSNYQPRGYYNNKGRGGGGRSGGGRSGGGGPVYNRQGGSNGGHASVATS